MKKDLLTLLDLTEEDFDKILSRAMDIKQRYKQGIFDKPLAEKTIGLLFDKPSTRTRISFETAINQLGGSSIFINSAETQLSRNESVEDTAKTLSKYLDGLVVRTYSQQWLEELALHADIPVINALTDSYHPTQILGDIMTVIEHKVNYKDLKIVWLGDGNNMANSWINAAVVAGFNLTVACPKNYFPDKNILGRAVEKKGSKVLSMSSDVVWAAKNADVINTDVWVSMGQEDAEEKKKALARYQVNADLLKHAKKDVIVLHCLPAHKGEEITREVFDGPNSVIWDQAENKLHMARALLVNLIT